MAAWMVGCRALALPDRFWSLAGITPNGFLCGVSSVSESKSRDGSAAALSCWPFFPTGWSRLISESKDDRENLLGLAGAFLAEAFEIGPGILS